MMLEKKKEEMRKRRRRRKDVDIINDNDDLIDALIGRMKMAAEVRFMLSYTILFQHSSCICAPANHFAYVCKTWKCVGMKERPSRRFQ
jgi:hypothetical protein